VLRNEGPLVLPRQSNIKSVCLILLAALCGCAQLSAEDRALGMFVMSDIKNAEFISAQAGLTTYTACLGMLEPVATPSPDPAHDGLLVLGARALALKQAVYGPCGSVLAPILLRALGKASAPFSIALPF
jgi:hypothetical protein